ncbi:MAG: iron-containing alcohol dehydrogenase family protein [Ilumatobacteraceae bacterium]|nr:iron-containing alcohol dehydrogenase family protein [Ilumatobacteraceae bacterium]
MRNVGGFTIGRGSLQRLPAFVDARRDVVGGEARAVYLVDSFFADRQDLMTRLGARTTDIVRFVDATDEPTTDGIDVITNEIRGQLSDMPATIVGFGGGTTMDTAKAVANLLTNGGKAADYQGWDLVKLPGVHKIAVPTISGTGSEATRTCVMTNTASGLKLGMNSDFTVFDQMVLDPDLTATVPRDQYFYTGMDAYIHCIEALAGSYRNAVGDAYSRETVNLCRQVFLADDMMSVEAREQLMVASYLGGCAIATSYVGVVHPFSAGLSVVLGLHHCIANCIALNALGEFYPVEHAEFRTMMEKQKVTLPSGVCANLSDEQYQRLVASTVVHAKPLTNALGVDFRSILTDERVIEIFKRM